MTLSTLTLLLPDLERLIPGGGEWPPLPTLQRLLSRGDRQPLSDDRNATLLALFDLQADDTGPLAPLRALGDGLEVAEGWWLCADPVHLVADRDQLYLSAHEALAVRQDEAEALIAALNRLYADEGWRFIAPAPDRWYLQLPAALAMQTIPTSTAMGRRVGEVLPRGKDAMDWQRVMTEIQMLFHSESVNLRREAEGQLAINSLWFWGGGAVPEPSPAVRWQCIVADDPLLLGLARLHGVETRSPVAELKDMPIVEGEVLWQPTVSSLEAFEAQVLAPLSAQLKSGGLDTLELIVFERGRWFLGRETLRRWWRRNRPLSSLLGTPGT